MLSAIVRHRSIQASVAAGMTLATASVVTDVPWPFWGAWATLSVISLAQAVRQ
ncbi:hypothetical protein [Pimelobacter simplex]|uniref:hypothetical protein n=1 Tax=Nocardioides simplex TaxID=2045 RepID=UPI0019326FDD|nr:hypothetical protein [Pimelobacter simplex]